MKWKQKKSLYSFCQIKIIRLVVSQSILSLVNITKVLTFVKKNLKKKVILCRRADKDYHERNDLMVEFSSHGSILSFTNRKFLGTLPAYWE